MAARLDLPGSPTTNTAVGGMAPRQWAARIVAIQTRECRKQALEEVPEIIRVLVEDLVRCAFDRRRGINSAMRRKDNLF